MRIFINPGHSHGGYDPGAVNHETGMTESEVVWEIGNLLAQYLNNVGIATEVVQSDNLYYDSHEQPCVVEEANNGDFDYFISIHCNSFNTKAQGTETLVYNLGTTAERLAHCIQDQIVNTFDTVDRGVKERTDLIVLKRTDMPAVLVETAFIDNPEDMVLLRDNRDEFARAIARGVTDFISAGE